MSTSKSPFLLQKVISFQLLILSSVLSAQTNSPETILKNQPEELREIDLMIDRKLDWMDVGSTVQFISVGSVAASILLPYFEYKNQSPTLSDIEKRQDTIKALAISGGIGFTIGTLINAVNRRELNKLMRKR